MKIQQQSGVISRVTRERLYRAYIEELKFFNPILRTQTNKDILANYKEVSSFEDLFWFDIYDGPEVVGFLLVANGTHCTKDADYMIMELYIHPNHRNLFGFLKIYFYLK